MTDVELIAAVRGAAAQTVNGLEHPAKDLMLAIAMRLEDWMDGDVTARPEIGITGTGLGTTGGWFKERTPPAQEAAGAWEGSTDGAIHHAINHVWDRAPEERPQPAAPPVKSGGWFKKRA